jgi:uridine kinase
MRFFFICFLFLWHSATEAKEPSPKGKLILLYGTQCAGKSTLCKELRRVLPGHVQVVKRTPFALELRKNHIEEAIGIRPHTHKEVIALEEVLPQKYRRKASTRFKKEALPATISHIRPLIAKGKIVILDVCLYTSEEIALMEDLQPVTVLVYSSLDELSIREQSRTDKEKRGEKAQMESRKYILNGFNLLYETANESEAVDTLSTATLMNYWHQGNHVYLDKDYFRIFQTAIHQFQLTLKKAVPIKPKYPPTVFIHTGRLSPQEGAQLVKKAIIY